MPRALITGITGQDGSYLSEHLLELGYTVYGLVRRTSGEIRPLAPGVHAIEGDLLDTGSLLRAVEESQPDEVYNLGAQSFVGRSWREPLHTAEVTGLGALRMLEACRLAAPTTRFYQASSSEMFGNAPGPHSAAGPFHPRSPYGSAKLFAHSSAVNYRESHGMFVSCGVLFNHESPRRGPEFVTRKVCRAAAAAARGDHARLGLGNLRARRDWGWAPDYVRAMHLLLRHPEPRDLIVATGVSHSVEDLCEAAYGSQGLDWRDHVEADAAMLRPAEVDALTGDPGPAASLIGWRPEVDFAEMVRRMVQAELS